METPPTYRYRALDIALMAFMALVLVLSAVWCLFANSFVVRSTILFAELDAALPVITQWVTGLARLWVVPLLSLVLTLSGFAALVLVKDRVRGILAAFACAVANGLVGLLLALSVSLPLVSILNAMGAP